MLRLLLDLARARRIDLRRRCPDSLPVVGRHHAGRMERLHDEQLDAQPELELATLAEDLAQLRQRVAVDHALGSMRSSAMAAWSARTAATRSATASSESARMRAARCAAFFAPALPIATVATGTPGGIWTTA